MAEILVADDRAVSRELIRMMLESCDFEVTEAADGAEVLASLAQRIPDLILLDLQMPALDGFGVVRQLQKCSEWAAIPVVALTASAMAGDREKALTGGFTGYITKPVRIKELRREIERLLKK